MLRFVVLLACSSCIQPPPHATVVVNTPKPAGQAVLVMPTKCVSLSWEGLCDPSNWGQKRAIADNATSFAAYIDPALRLKLELAGFTLAEAAVMRLVTADRVDTNGVPRVEEAPADVHTVAELSVEDARAVARSLGITAIILPTFALRPAKYMTNDGELTIVMVDVATGDPLWTVTCKENVLSIDETPNRLANCVGNGVLAMIAPDNLIGKAL